MTDRTKDRKTVDPNPHRIKRSIHYRVKWLYGFFALLSVMILIQILLTQWGPNGRALRNLSENRCYTVRTIYGSRGNIYDRCGALLSTDTHTYDIYLDLAVESLTDSVFAVNLRPLVDSLNKMFGPKKDWRKFLTTTRYNVLHGGSHYVKLVGGLNRLEYERLSRFPLMGSTKTGTIADERPTRYKVYGNMASYTISQGIEKAYDDVLHSTDGVNRYVKIDKRGNAVPIVDTLNREAVNGMDIITTIDADIQDVAECALRRRLESNDAKCGTVVVVETATGEIRAMANLTRYTAGKMNDDFNYAIRWYGDPGSTFKGVSLLVILDEAGVPLTRRVDCTSTGRAVVNGKQIRDDHKVGRTNIKGMFAQSSNIGFAKVVDSLYRRQPERYIDRIREIGIDRTSDIQQIGGLPFRMKDPSSFHKRGGWSHTTLTQNAYGYELNMTPMHTLMFYNAVANGGKLVAPQLVKRIEHDGRTVREFETEVINPQICSESTIASLHSAMEAVVTDGTGKALADLPYRVAGKTGTAQIHQSTGLYQLADGSRDYLATFVGYFPAEAPKYTCIVSIMTNMKHLNKAYTGAGVSLPVFREVADYIYTHDPSWRTEVVGAAEPQKLTPKQPLPNDLTAESMPNVVGMGLTDALWLLEQLGLDVEFKGSGTVREQSKAAGLVIERGEKVRIILSNGDKQ